MEKVLPMRGARHVKAILRQPTEAGDLVPRERDRVNLILIPPQQKLFLVVLGCGLGCGNIHDTNLTFCKHAT